ncbi:endolytic transglycosylase MltG [Leifsonia sp. NPDC058248]|uniref:endolytic transglycosylase MltG n=1 Tax=Leifsonia sp. NPDC058248 TaxID=3346402 RepID=UPI0036DE5EA9
MSQNPHPPGPGETIPPADAEREFDPFDALFDDGMPEVTTAPAEPTRVADAPAAPVVPVVPDAPVVADAPVAPAVRRAPRTRREAREAQGGSPLTAEVPVQNGAEEIAAASETDGGPARDGSAPPESPLAWRQQHYVSHEKPRKKKRSLKPLWVTLLVVAILGGLAGGAYAAFQPQVAKLVEAITPKNNDYSGSGTGSVLVSIASGDTGSDVATKLHSAGVTKSYEAFYSLLLRQKPEVQFQPGAFKLAKQMSAQSALLALEDPASRVENTAVIPEGTAEKDILPIVADATKIPVADLTAAAANPAQYGVPAQAKTLEGFLFPATYTFAPGITAHDAIKTLVDRSFQALDEAGVAPADRWKTVVLASIVQREAGLAPDYPKVSRVFLNRLAQGWKLQSDATVAYGTGNTHTVTTTDAERANAANLYNTYVHPGLPVGPISNPGDLAINAALHPAAGPWMFFVTWNLKTGETIFSTTVEEHDAAVAKWQQWMRDNPGYG